MCEQMKWSHLPLPGGLYAQDPDLLDRFMYIFSERNAFEAREAKRKDRKGGGGTLGRSARSM